MILAQPSFSLRMPVVAAVIALVLGALFLVARPAGAAYVLTGDLLGQTCRDVAVRTTCDPPFKIDEVRAGETELAVPTVFPAVTDVEGNQCRVRVNPRASLEAPEELRPLMTAKFLVDHHEGLNAVPVDFLVFTCRSQ